MAIPADDFVRFCERTIDGMVAAVRRLDDDEVNRPPPLVGGNTPYQLVTHALSACAWWTSHIVCGRPSSRDRDSEFRARGPVAELENAAAHSKAALRDLLPTLATADRLHGVPMTQTELDGEWTVGAALIHAYEELAQHLGHLEVTVDLILTGRSSNG